MYSRERRLRLWGPLCTFPACTTGRTAFYSSEQPPAAATAAALATALAAALAALAGLAGALAAAATAATARAWRPRL